MPPRFFWVFVACALATGGRADAPDWLTALAARPVTELKDAPPALVLLDESTVELDTHGQMVTTHRRALRLLHQSAKTQAAASVSYNGKDDKVLVAKAWLLRKKDTIKTLGESAWFDFAAGASRSVVDEMRSRACSLDGEALVVGAGRLLFG